LVGDTSPADEVDQLGFDTLLVVGLKKSFKKKRKREGEGDCDQKRAIRRIKSLECT
jgi:hypothetical protein